MGFAHKKKIKEREAALKNEAGGDEKHMFVFTWPKEDSTQLHFNVQKMSLLNLFNKASHPIDIVFLKTIL